MKKDNENNHANKYDSIIFVDDNLGEHGAVEQFRNQFQEIGITVKQVLISHPSYFSAENREKIKVHNPSLFKKVEEFISQEINTLAHAFASLQQKQDFDLVQFNPINEDAAIDQIMFLREKVSDKVFCFFHDSKYISSVSKQQPANVIEERYGRECTR
jgi:hypothetical protein